MKLGILNVDSLNRFNKLYYTFMMEVSAYHDVISNLGVELYLLAFDEASIKSYNKNKQLFPYSYLDYKITLIDDPSIDMYHLVELNPANEDENFKEICKKLISTGKPIVYTDSDGEYSNRKRNGWTKKLPVGEFLLKNAKHPQITIQSTCQDFANEYSQDFSGSRVFYCPYILSSRMEETYKAKNINKVSDLAFVGSLSGRPHAATFFEEVSANGLDVSLGLFIFDRMKVKGSWYTPIHDYCGLKYSRSEYFQFLSNFRFAFIGSGWFMKRDRPVSTIKNPQYSTFRILEPLLTRQLPISYKTPELEKIGVNSHLLIDWEGFSNHLSLTNKIKLLKVCKESPDLLNKTVDEYVTKVRENYGPQSPYIETIKKVFEL